jgi:mono/diheme cytochrome c family protein
LVLSFVCGSLAACGSGDGFPVGGSQGPLRPTFGSIQANIFTPICEQCHSGANAPRGLRLDAANSFALLVGVPSGQQPGVLRVAPHDPGSSYLIRKLEGTAGTGERMPAGLPPLPQADIDVVRQWISDGALPDAPQSTLPVRVTSLAPLPDEVAPALPASITAVFDRDLNATTVDATTFRLVRSGGDGAFGDGADVTIVPSAVTVPTANPGSAVMDLTGVASVADRYRITLSGGAPAAILDLAGNALDGEFAGTFPSGDGMAGGHFAAEFDVVGVQPNLQSIQSDVFTPVCSGCHTGGGAMLPGSMNLTTENASFASLVGVASVQVPALQRVAPNEADDSYLIRKLEGDPGIVGGRMPLFGPYLEQATIDAIRQWIDNGAGQ